MTVAIQQWLAVRLDFFGNILVLGIVRNTVNPSKIGVVLSYTLSITEIFGELRKIICLPSPMLTLAQQLKSYPSRSERTKHERSGTYAGIH